MSAANVVVTGLGIITSNGNNTTEFFSNCQKGQRGIRELPCSFFDSSRLRTSSFGWIQNLDEQYATRPRTLAAKAVFEALEDAGLPHNLDCFGKRCAITIGSLNYEDDDNTAYYMENHAKPEREDFSVFLKNLLKVKGECYNFSSACASGTTAIGAAFELICSDDYDIVVVCGVDALSQANAYGFNSLRVLSTGLCHPLDENRNGINIGEGCGVLILESESFAQKRKAESYAYVLGHSDRNEAYHITSPDVSSDGFYRSMYTALQNAGITPEDVDYINLHGTGTAVNDKTELTAISHLYKKTHKPYVSSLKTLIGHCMGAAGTLEAVLTVLCVKHSYYYPIQKVTNPQSELKDFTLTPPEQPLRIALSNSFGFAGNTASIIFSAEPPRKPFPVSSRNEENQTATVYLNGIGTVLPEENPTSGSIPGISPRKLLGISSLSRKVLTSAVMAEQDGGYEHTKWNPDRIGTFFSAACGEICSDNNFVKAVWKNEPDSCSPTEFANLTHNAPLGHMCINLNCRGTSLSLHGAAPLKLSYEEIKNENCDIALSCMAEPNEVSTLLLSNKQTKDSYCKISEVKVCDCSAFQNDADALTNNVDLIFDDGETDTANNSLYANMIKAAKYIKQSPTPKHVLVSGTDHAANLFTILLETVDR